jgi:hypothetical protein
MKLTLIFFILALNSLLYSSAWALSEDGRITIGGLVAKEQLSEQSGSNSNNNVALISTRFYQKLSEFSKANLQFVWDLRDKHDFFDKVDKERLQLTSSNSFQVNRFYMAYASPSKRHKMEVGRFFIPEAGSAYADGVKFGGNFLLPNLDTSLFAGLNPKQHDKNYLTFSSQSQIYGGYFLYQNNPKAWSGYTYFSNALTVERFKQQTDRTYWYQNLVFQPNRYNRLISYFYLDFVPKTYLQNAYASIFHEWLMGMTMNLSGLSYDVIEYKRHQDIREHLDSNPYREGKMEVGYRVNEDETLKLWTTYGVRQKDKLVKRETMGGVSLSMGKSPNIPSNIYLGQRKNFVTDDLVSKINVGFYTDEWEVSLDNELIREKRKDGTVDWPLVTELSFTHLFSKVFYMALSFQRAKDDQASIYSGFLHATYRFGNKISPLLPNQDAIKGRPL